ncbi:hypothetical protein [Actinomycetospora sp. CA-084318]|uniref:hypothetical protein n=1 Tax=Actinomycetospora sp. CA-084318 TaxID=3239892 RepID=UPI003D99DFFE
MAVMLCGDGCRSFADAHRVHHIRARRAGESPWGWRDAVVESVTGGRVVVRYVEPGVDVTLTHHREAWVSPGDPVRVHEEFRLLDVRGSWLGVAVDGGLGAVPVPDHADLWTAESVPGIADLTRGEAAPGDR